MGDALLSRLRPDHRASKESLGGADSEIAHKKWQRKHSVYLAIGTLVVATAGGCVLGNSYGRSAQRSHDLQGFTADQQNLHRQQLQDATLLQAARNLGNHGITNVAGLHFGAKDELFATISTAAP